MAMQLFQRNSEAKLVEALNSVTNPEGWHAVHFHLSGLMEQFKSEYQVKIAVNLINDLLKNFDGGIFVLQDSSIIVVCYALEKGLQNKLIFQLRYLYMDDPLAYSDSGEENPAFCTAYDLAKDWNDFMEISTRRMALTSRRASSARAEKIAESIPDKNSNSESKSQNKESHKENNRNNYYSGKSEQEAEKLSELMQIKNHIKEVKIDSMIRSQPICAVQPGMPIKKVFDEIYVYMTQLSSMLQTEAEFFSNRWLFRYLTQLLDVRMLNLLSTRRESMLDGNVSINVNVETLLSQSFQEFDLSLDSTSKAGIVLEVPLVDVFADMAGFHVARKEMQTLGYRICLDGVTADSLNHIQREKLGVDLVKVQWHANLLEHGVQRQNMAQAVSINGSSRVILCRCDNRQAIEFGQSIGIALFQGRYVDSVINPLVKSNN